jgi:hypothetical protein
VLGVEIAEGNIVVVLDDDGEFTRPCPGPADASRGTVFAVAVPYDWARDDSEVEIRTETR